VVNVIKAVLLDLGDTLIHERVDDAERLDQMSLHAKPGASEVLDRLSRLFVLGLVTDTETSNEIAVREALRRLGLENFFRAVVTSQDIGVTKPDPAMFREALRRVGVDAVDTVMVGNDLDRDITPALALGMHGILVSDSAYYDPRNTTTAPVAETLREVPDLIAAMAPGSAEVTGSTGPGAAANAPEGAAATSNDVDDLRVQYAAAVQMSVYDGQLSWQVTGLYVQFAFLLAAGAIFPSFVGPANQLVVALAGGLVALAGLVTALMFGSMCMRIRTYQDLWVARAEEIEQRMSGPGVLSAGGQLSSGQALSIGANTLRMSRVSAIRTKTMMNVLFGVFVAVFLGLMLINVARAVGWF
jgi:HAD superfamily hydrolase (TIGR01509 family)